MDQSADDVAKGQTDNLPGNPEESVNTSTDSVPAAIAEVANTLTDSLPAVNPQDATGSKFSLLVKSEDTTKVIIDNVHVTSEEPAKSCTDILNVVIPEAANGSTDSLPVVSEDTAKGSTANLHVIPEEATTSSPDSLPAVIPEAANGTTDSLPVVSEETAREPTTNLHVIPEEAALSSTDSPPVVILEAVNGPTDSLPVFSEETAEGSTTDLHVIPEEDEDWSTIIADDTDNSHAKILSPSSLFISREEMERIKRRLTLVPGRAEDFLPMSTMEIFCRKSQEAINKGLNESYMGLLNVPNRMEARKSLIGIFPSSQLFPGVPSPPSGISWRDELKALKEELALPASVSRKISGMEKARDSNTVNKPDSGKSDGSQQDEGPALNLVEKPATPPPYEVFLKDLDLDFLSTIGSGRIDSNLARESVFVNFDPIVVKALKERDPSGDQRKESSAESAGQTIEISEDSVQRISAVQKQISNNRKRDLKELDDLIEKLTLEIEEQQNKVVKMPEVLSTSEQTELLMKLDVEIARLRAELCAQPAEIQKLLDEIDECDQLVVQLTEDMGKFEANKGKLLEEKVQDNNSHKEHLEYMEEMFDNLYQNYKKAKESRKGLMNNKAVLEKHNQHLTEVDTTFKENLRKIKAEHEQTIMNAKRELASKELEIRELKKQQAQKNSLQTFS